MIELLRDAAGAILAIGLFVMMIYWSISFVVTYWPEPKKYMTNDEIIAEHKKCTDAGMDSSQIINGWNYKVHQVRCIPLK